MSAKRASALGAIALLLSCTTDDAVSPSRSREVPLEPSRVVTVVGSASIGVQSDNNTQSGGLPQFWESFGGTPDHSTGITIPPNSLYRVIVTGRIILDVNGPWASVCQQTFTPPMVGSYGPVGTGRNNNELRVHLKLVASSGSASEIVFYQGQVGTSAPDSAVSDYLYTDTGGVLWAGHAGVFGETGGCGPNHDQGFGMYAMSGSQTIRVETETTPFRLTAVPNHIHAGDSVTFTAMRTDNGSQLVDIRSRGWNNPQGQPAAGPSCGLVENPCRRPVSASGTMWIFAAMASHGWVATADVTVFSTFTVDADKSSVQYGDTVTFTPKYDGAAGPAAKWTWAPV